MSTIRRITLCMAVACASAALSPRAAHADAGGLSFWLPGLMGSLAAAPGTPGWSLATIYLHLHSKAEGGRSFHNGGSLVAGLDARADALAIAPTYTFATPVLGAQAAVAVIGVPGRVRVGVEATLAGPNGGAVSGSRSDARSTWADVFYQGTLKWNHGVHNTMVYVTGNVPSGTYDPGRLANLSFGFVAVDAGAGYTYLNPQTGHEFSVVGGLTYSGINRDTQYRNGIDSHVDWAASQFINQHVHIGIAGYFFQQLTGDSGAGATLGPFKGRAIGIGPQIGFMFKAWEGYSGYLNLRGYRDVDVENRPRGTTIFATLVFSPAAHSPPTPRAPMHVKAP